MDKLLVVPALIFGLVAIAWLFEHWWQVLAAVILVPFIAFLAFFKWYTYYERKKYEAETNKIIEQYQRQIRKNNYGTRKHSLE